PWDTGPGPPTGSPPSAPPSTAPPGTYPGPTLATGAVASRTVIAPGALTGAQTAVSTSGTIPANPSPGNWYTHASLDLTTKGPTGSTQLVLLIASAGLSGHPTRAAPSQRFLRGGASDIG